MSKVLKKLSGDCLDRFLQRLNNIDHVKKRNITYVEHFIIASFMGLEMIKGGVLLLVHSIIPNYFQSSGSDTIRNLHKKL
jgi:hypothetical protein